MNKELFFQSLRGKRVTFCGIGRSHLPLMDLFLEKGAVVSARDKRTREQLGEQGDQLEAKGVRLILGEDYLQNLDEDIIFRTPGMKYHLPQLEEARARGQAVTSEMEVFFQLCPCKIYAVTGSDGKTTTTSIIAELLKAQGKTVHLGGNIGKPLLPEIETIAPEDVAVVELSSFQLISMRESPDVAVVTNLSPNHLDVHKDMQEYIDAKKNILLHQGAFSRTVLNAGNEITASFAPEVRGDCWMFRRGGPEVIMSLLGEDVVDAVVSSAVKAKSKNGVAFIMDANRGEDKEMDREWEMIEVIVEKGYSEDVMAAARKAGASGGTVINAHGTASEEDAKFFGISIVPEKEILLIVAKSDVSAKVCEVVRNLECLKKKGMGILFTIPVKNFVSLG